MLSEIETKNDVNIGLLGSFQLKPIVALTSSFMLTKSSGLGLVDRLLFEYFLRHHQGIHEGCMLRLLGR